MLLRCASPFDSEDYLFEVKWDGARGIALVGASSYRLLSRHGIDMTERFPELGFLQKLKPGTVLDGEVVVLKNGKPDFGLLLSRLGTQSELKTRVLSHSTRATYVVFDQPYESHAPLLEKPLRERRERLHRTVETLGETGLFFSEGIRGKGKAFFKEVSGRGLEGVVAKRLESRYSAGKRSDAWLKIKRRRVMVCTVMGYVPSGRKGFQSLILASQLGGELRCVGRLSRGFDGDARRRLESLLRSRLTENAIVPTTRKGQWVEPGIYLTVSYHELTARGRLRFPVFDRICDG
jgi:DNA ligase D-like protein (predicted ligase)